MESINVHVSLHYIHMYMYKDTRMIITMTNALAKGRFLKYNIYIQFIFPLTIALDIYDVQSLPTHGA